MGSNQENSEKHHLFHDISRDSEKIPVKSNRQWSLIFSADEKEICPEQEAITKLIYQQKQAISVQSQSLHLPHINFVDYKINKL